jgi:hypothetical protein
MASRQTRLTGKTLKRASQTFGAEGGALTLWAAEIVLRRSDIFIDNRHRNRRQLRRSGILGYVAWSRIHYVTSICTDCLSDVAPTELRPVLLRDCYKDFAPTELFWSRESPNRRAVRQGLQIITNHESGIHY